MASVYRAHDRLLERDTALKLLTPALSADPSSRERFRLEAQTTTRLNHPNIARLYSYGEENGQLYMAMELIEGRSLADLLRESKRLDKETFRTIFTGVLEALSYAHKEGVVHRDLKPSNIMLTINDDGKTQPKIVDFGLAKILSATEQTRTVTAKGAPVGSPLYMSPEQCKGIEIDARSDVYSIACVMYECLAGKTPFSGESPYETMYEHLTRSVPQFDELSGPIPVPRAVALVIIKALSKEREHRQQSVDQLRDEMEAAFNDKSVYPRKSGGKPVALIACVAVFIAIAGCTALMLPLRNNNNIIITPSGSNDKATRPIATGARSCYNTACEIVRRSKSLPSDAPDSLTKQKAARMQAIEYLLKGSDACEKAGNKDVQLLFDIEIQLGYLEQENCNWDRSIQHLNKALNLFPSREFPGYWNQLQASTAIAVSYKAMKQYPRGFEVLTSAIQAYEFKEGQVEQLSDAYSTLAEFYLSVNNQTKALETYRKSLNIALKAQPGWNSYSAIHSAAEVARWEFKLVTADAARKTLKRAESETDKFETADDLPSRYALLAESSLSCGFRQNALRLYTKADALVDKTVEPPLLRAGAHKAFRREINKILKLMARPNAYQSS